MSHEVTPKLIIASDSAHYLAGVVTVLPLLKAAIAVKSLYVAA